MEFIRLLLPPSQLLTINLLLKLPTITQHQRIRAVNRLIV